MTHDATTALLTQCRHELTAYQPGTSDEKHDKNLFLAALKDDQVLWRSGASGHLTASVYIVDPAGRVLLTHHRKYQQWQQLGGHLEHSDTSLAAAALREAREESGLPDLHLVADPVHLVTIPVNCPVPGSYHFDVRYLVLSDSAEYQVSDESLDLGWFAPTTVPSRELSVVQGCYRAVARARELGHAR